MAGWSTFDVGGCCCEGFIHCLGCDVPVRNLTVDWTNTIIGNGSAVLVSNGAGRWISGCTNQVIYRLQCGLTDAPEFRVTYFVAGVCPTGTSQSCATGQASFGLIIASRVCGSAFDMEIDISATGVVQCPQLVTNGYTHFRIH